MSVLADHQVDAVHHYAPLHYLIFIARSHSILSKPSLHKAGFTAAHLRSMSHGLDVTRGFGSYSHRSTLNRASCGQSLQRDSLISRLTFPHLR
jgi:hypothetical protein